MEAQASRDHPCCLSVHGNTINCNAVGLRSKCNTIWCTVDLQNAYLVLGRASQACPKVSNSSFAHSRTITSDSKMEVGSQDASIQLGVCSANIECVNALERDCWRRSLEEPTTHSLGVRCKGRHGEVGVVSALFPVPEALRLAHHPRYFCCQSAVYFSYPTLACISNRLSPVTKRCNFSSGRGETEIVFDAC